MEGFTFWRSYFETIKRADAETVKELLLAIGCYMFDDEEPDVSGTAALLFEAFRGNLDKSKRRSAAGKKGGSVSPSHVEKQTEAKAKQNESSENEHEALKTKNKEQKTKNEKQKTESLSFPQDGQEEGGSGGEPSFTPEDGPGGWDSPRPWKPPDDVQFGRMRHSAISMLRKAGPE